MSTSLAAGLIRWGLRTIAMAVLVAPWPVAHAWATHPVVAGSRDGGQQGETRNLPRIGSGRSLQAIGSGRTFGAIGSGRMLPAVGSGRAMRGLGSDRPFGRSSLPPAPPPGEPSGLPTPKTGTEWSRSLGGVSYGAHDLAQWRLRSLPDPDQTILDSLRARPPMVLVPFDVTEAAVRRLGPVEPPPTTLPRQRSRDLQERVSLALAGEAVRALRGGHPGAAWRLLARVAHDPEDPVTVLLPRAWALVGLGRDQEAAAEFGRLDQVAPGWIAAARDGALAPLLRRDGPAYLARVRRDRAAAAATPEEGYLDRVLRALQGLPVLCGNAWPGAR